MPRMKTVNKSQLIRDMLDEMGMDASPTEVSQRLTAQGHDVSPNMGSGIKVSMKKHGRKGRRRNAMRNAMRNDMPNAMPTAEGHPSIEEVYKVWALANQIGGHKLKQIVKHMP
jgi:hypothetical protein